MFRISPFVMFSLFYWAAILPGFSQAKTGETKTTETKISESKTNGIRSRLEEARTDIALLKRLLKEQDRRISELESTVKALQAVEAPERTAGAERARLSSPAAWQSPAAWSQIKEGMSRAQVEEILGKPDSVDSVIDYQTLIYKAYVPGAGTISGSVQLTDDRVSQITPPEF